MTSVTNCATVKRNPEAVLILGWYMKYAAVNMEIFQSKQV